MQGLNPLQQQETRDYGRGNYMPPVETTYWAMRVMAYLGSLVFLVLGVGALLWWRKRFERSRWFLWAGVCTVPLPYLAALAGWVLTESGRQPWIVWGLLQTADANSPSVSTSTLTLSLIVFGLLYLALTVLNFVLLRRYARFDPPDVGGEGDEFAVPAVSY